MGRSNPTLLPQLCAGEADASERSHGDTNPDPQKDTFESRPGRWGENKQDRFTHSTDGDARNVVASGMSRFEVGKSAPRQPPWERLSPTVLCVLAHNPSAFTLNGTCCYLVGTGPKRLLIDTGEDSFGHARFLETLDDCMQANGIEGLEMILITHLHHDHYGGVTGLLKRYGARIPVAKLPNPGHYWTTAELVRERGLLPFLEHEDGTPRFVPSPTMKRDDAIPQDKMLVWPDEEAEAGKPLSWDLAGRTKHELIRDYYYVKRSYAFGQKLGNGTINFHELRHAEVITTQGATLIAFHTPGHSQDHASFWHAEEKSMFSGDHVLGWGTTFIFDLYDYMKSLEFMIALRPVHLYPGHGPMIQEGVSLLERYIVHRRLREHQVEDVLLAGVGGETVLSAGQVVRYLYKDTARERLWMARENVQKVLRKFDRDGLAHPFIGSDESSGASTATPVSPENTKSARKLKLEPYSFAENFMELRKFPSNLYWVHRAHLNALDLADRHNGSRL